MASAFEIAGWTLDAGWKGPDAVTATATALASGADPSKPSGLFGIGSSGDGPTQTRTAYQFWKGSGWNAFPAYQNGRWRLFLPVATPAVAAATVADVGESGAGVVKDVTGAAAGTATAVVNAADVAGRIGGFLTNPDAIGRIIKVVVGSALVVGAALYLGKRGTIDQGSRFLRKVSEYADLIFVARAAGATRPGRASAAASSSPPPRSRAGGGQAAAASSTHSAPGRHRAPDKTKEMPKARTIAQASDEQKSPKWSNEPTRAHTVVGKARVKAARPLPGESSMPKTGIWKGSKK